MTNIDPTRITDAEWKKWAEDADKAKKSNKDGKLLNSAFEIEYFKNEARKAGKSEEAISTFLANVDKKRAEYSEESKSAEKSAAATATEIMGGEFSHSKKATQVIHNNVLNHIYAKGLEAKGANIDYKKLSADVRKEILDNANQDPAKYAKLMDEVDKMASVMQNAKYNSKEDVRGLYKKLESSVDKKDPNREFKLNVLKQFINVAEANQKAKETDLVNKKYEQIQNMDREKIVQTMKDTFKGSYFDEVISEFEENTIQKKATKEVWDLIDAQKGSGVTDSKKIENAVIAELKNLGHYDKYAKKALNGRKSMSFSEVMNFEKSNVKAKRKEAATDNRIAERTAKDYTEDDFLKRLRTDDALAGLIKSGLIVQKDGFDEDGNPIYDITNLAERIRQKVGAELEASKQKTDYLPYSELENIVKNISAECGVKISKKDAKSLIKMCGIPIENKNWAKIIYGATVGTLSDAAASVVSAVSVGAKAVNPRYNGNRGPFKVTTDVGTVTFDYNKSFPIQVNVVDNNHFELLFQADGGAKVDMMGLLESLADSGLTSDNVNVQQLENGFKLIIDKSNLTQVNVVKNISETLSKEVGPITRDVLPEELGINFDDVSADAKTTKVIPAMLKGLAVGFALNLLNEAMKEQGELPIVATQFSTNDIDLYKKEIDFDKKLTPAQKEGLKALADVYVKLDANGQPVKDKDGKLIWDSKRFKAALNAMGGDASFVNRREFAVGVDNALRQYQNAMKKVKAEPAQVVKQTETVVTPAPVKEPTEKVDAYEVPQPDKAIEPNYNFGNKHTWKGLAALYGAKTPAEIKAVFTELKKINGIDPKDNVIPKDLYLPDTIGDRKRQDFLDDKAREKFVYDNDKKIAEHKDPISHGTKLGTVKQGSKWRGFKEVDGKRIETESLYDTEEQAKAAAKDLKVKK